MSKTVKAWDTHAIKAEVWRRGMTLQGIALSAGLYKSACRQGLFGTSRKGAQAIATALGIPFRELFPDNYTRGRHGEEKGNSKERRAEGQKTGVGLDAATLAA